MTDDASTDLPLAGWYPHGASSGMLRYWTGSAWTEHVVEAPSQVPTAALGLPEQGSVEDLEAEFALPAAHVHGRSTPAAATGDPEAQAMDRGADHGLLGSPERSVTLAPIVTVDGVSALAAAAAPVPAIQSDSVPALRMVQAAPAVAASLREPPATAPMSYAAPTSSGAETETAATLNAHTSSDVLAGAPGRRRSPIEVDRGHSRRIWLTAAVVVGILTLLGTGLWLLRPHSDRGASTGTSSPTGSAAPAETPQAFQTGATYIATTTTGIGGLPSCAATAASWKASGPKIVVTVTTAGPKNIVAIAIDKTNPGRPNASHGAVSLKAGQKVATVTFGAPPGGVDRVQVGIQWDQGIQRCNAPKAT